MVSTWWYSFYQTTNHATLAFRGQPAGLLRYTSSSNPDHSWQANGFVGVAELDPAEIKCEFILKLSLRTMSEVIAVSVFIRSTNM